MVYCLARRAASSIPFIKGTTNMFSRIGRVLVAAALVAAGLAVASLTNTSSAGAANTAVTVSCPAGGSALSVNNGDTVTVTVGTGCTQVLLNMNGSGGTATANGFPLTPGSPVGVAQGDTVIYTAPNSGAGNDSLIFMVNFAPSSNLYIAFPPPTGSIVDQGNGSMVITYTGDILVMLFASGTTCPQTYTGQPTPRYFLDPTMNGPAALGASPATVSAGTNAMGPSGPSAVGIVAGTYQACMYFSGNNATTLHQSLSVTLGSPTPTPSNDPVVPVPAG